MQRMEVGLFVVMTEVFLYGVYATMFGFYLHVLRKHGVMRNRFLIVARISLFLLCTAHCALLLATTEIANLNSVTALSRDEGLHLLDAGVKRNLRDQQYNRGCDFYLSLLRNLEFPMGDCVPSDLAHLSRTHRHQAHSRKCSLAHYRRRAAQGVRGRCRET
ncbi:hypothetical protein K438DRAFT_2022602 [Mycena galopus ATCC 62051]|nr:hypothetical protein K438DRAFT_2022602 [Mycena galopus ATCC 62051]